ncbi:ulp1 protease family, C-terminal catalytic domain-containing protein [Tanacetum coccineum]
MEGIRRSGRLKCKGPVIKENSIDEAIDVDEYLSEEEGSEYSIKTQGDNTDASPSSSGIKKIEDEKDGKITKKRKMDNTIGIGKFLHFKVKGIPSKLGFYVLYNFDEKTMEIKLENASLLITMESIADMIGIINKGVDIFAKDVMMYVDGTVCKDFRVGRKRPPITMWTKELLKERELAEIKSGGLGKGELAGLYVEEQDGPMPDNLELEKRFIESLQYQQEENEDIGRASVHTEDETMANEGQEQSMEAGDRTDILSFSLGLTQGKYDMGAETHQEVVNTSKKGVEAFSSRKSESRFNIDREENRVKARQDQLDVVPLNFFSPTNEVIVCGRRAVTLTDRMKSPFYIRVVNADKVENSKEKRLANILFKKRAGDDNDVLSTTKYGHQSSRGQIETLGPHEPVDDNVLSSWSAYLNFMEEKKDSISPARLFFSTFEVDKKLFAGDNAYTLEMFMEYAENANSSYGGQTMLEKADIVFIPVSNDQHKFIVCVNLKNPAVTLIDSKKEGNKVTRKKRKDEDINDMRVASILHRIFGQYLYAINHVKAAQIIECQLVRGKKQNTQLGRLRNKYAAKLLLSYCNIYKGKIHEEMDGK